jgi:hypothetical protein
MGKIYLREPTIVFVAGGPCTGKTTLLNHLLPQLDRVMLVDKDDISDSMMRTPDKDATGGKYDLSWMKLTGQKHPITGEFYRDYIGMQTHHAMLEIAATNFKLFDLSLFLQGNYTSHIKQGYFPEVVSPFLTQKGIAGYKLILCHANPDEIRARIRDRNDPRDASKLESPEAMDKYIASQDFVPQRVDELDHVKLDSTSNSVQENARLAVQYLLR